MEGINLEINKIYFYCDSKTVLNYISNKNSNFGVYVAHRIKKNEKIVAFVNGNTFHLT